MTEPRDTLKVAVLGCGYWGKNHVRIFSELGALAAISDPDPQASQALSEQFGVPARNVPEVLADPLIQGVVIAAPAAYHSVLAHQALSAGKHVLVEKPLALHAGAAEELCRLAEKAGRVLMVGHLLQYHPAFVKLKEIVHAGRLGRIYYLYSNRLNLGKVRREENILWSFAPHDLSMILSLVGQEPATVAAKGNCYLHKEIADVTTTTLDFPGGESAHVFVSWLHPFKEQKLVVVGEKGMAVFDDGLDWPRKVEFYGHSIAWVDGHPQPSRADAEPIPVVQDEPLKLECSHFLDCMSNGATPRTDGWEGLRVLRVLDAAERAMAKNASVPVRHEAPPVTPEQDHPGVMVHPSAFIDEPCTLGEGTKIWHFSHVLKGSRIGRNCVVGQNCMIGPDVTLGDNCKLQNNVSIYPGVTLEDGVFCGPSCVFTNVNNPRAEIERKDEFRPTLVKRGATIGANATIVCGTTLGEFSFIAAGAVVTKTVPPHALMAGVPAKRVGWMSHAGERLGPDLVCPREGRRYREVDADTLEEIAP